MRSILILSFLGILSFYSRAQVSFDFENGVVDGWLQAPESRWTASNTSPISGSFSLKHSYTGADKDRISTSLPVWDGSGGTVTWRFLLRHGYNPSSSNNWGVYLFSDRDATGMISTGTPNGYAVGVNLTGFDDILKLYRVTNGVFTPIITTSINWEETIKTTGTGAIEVTRKPDGSFTLKVSVTGSYLNMISQGTSVDLSYPFGGFFGIYYAYTSSGSERLWIDDVSINFNPINPNDHDALVVAPEEQIAGGYISSLITQPSQAVDIFCFDIQDQGTSDGLPTRTTRLRFTKVESAQAIGWAQAIGGIIIKNVNSEEIPLEAVYIMADAIEVDVEPASISVPNGSSAQFTLSLYLKPGGVADGQTIQLKVDDVEHGWDSDFNGSGYAESFPSPIISNEFTISVPATHLYFLEYPQQIVINQPFSVSAYAGDSEGNLSGEFSSAVSVNLAQGTGTLSPLANLTVNAVQGVATWSGLKYSARDSLKLSATSEGLQGITGFPIAVTNDNTTIVQTLTSQPVGVPISSLKTTPGQAVEVFKFRIFDPGNFDNVPTYVSQINIKRPVGDNLASFSRNIAGIILKVGSTIISAGSPSILSGSITIPIPMGGLVIPDGERLDVSLWIYLNDSGLEDEKVLGFMVDSQNHGFLAYADGSIFSETFLQSVVSNSFPVDVLATRVSFSSVPQFVGLGESFSVEAIAVDFGGSQDINATGNVVLSKNAGDGWLTIPSASTSFSAGVAKWNGLVYYMAQPFTLLASSPDLDDAISPLIYCADRTSTILSPPIQISNGLIGTLSVDSANSFDAFKFLIRDGGETDGLPTYVTQLAFHSFGQSTDIPLNKLLNGAFVTANDQVIKATASVIEATRILLSFQPGSLVVPDGESIEFTLKLFLKKGGLNEGSTIKVHVPSADHGWLTSSSGSGFPVSFSSGVVGPSLQLNVEATKLLFTSQPFGTSTDQPFTLEAAATDSLGNIDRNYLGSLLLSLESGPSDFSVESADALLTNGVAGWSNVSLPEVGEYVFRAVHSSAQSFEALSETIWNGGGVECVVNENFDLGYPDNFPVSTAWNASSVSPIEGEMSLKHALSGVAGESKLAIPLNINNLGNGPVEWSFVMRNGNWDPTSDNAFWVVLSSDKNNLNIGEINGYAVGVNLNGSTDKLSLWRLDTTQTSKLIIETELDWNEGETVGIRVTRSPIGEWNFWYQPLYGETPYLHGGSCFDFRHTNSVSFGPTYKFTSSRAGEFWLDNLKVCQTSFPPKINAATVISLTSVDVEFSEPINNDDAGQISYFSIRTMGGEPVGIADVYPNLDNPAKVTLSTDILPMEDLWLIVDGVRDLDGNPSIDSVMFGLGASGVFGKVIINEIMAKPATYTQLPDVEYIELFNRTEIPVALNGWSIMANDKKVTLPNATIEPNGFILLCSTGAEYLLSDFGNTVGVTSFPSLNNTGMFLALYDQVSKIISWVDYSENWYGDEIKKAGGYSLERIDPNNLVEGARNWTGSNDASGGTPGRENSVLATNPDIIEPRVIQIEVIDPDAIEITFSESMDSLSITLPNNYTLSNGIGTPIWAVASGPIYNKVSLTFSSSMVFGEIYDLCITEGVKDFSANTLMAECFSVALHQQPITGDVVVNEILFNPYSGGVDFVEIYNNSKKVFDLSRIWIANRNIATGSLSEFYLASDTSRLLFPDSYAVLSVNPNLVQQFYFVENPNSMIWTTKMPSYPNDNGYVVILDEFGEVIDEFSYSEKMHYQLLSSVKGVSLERIHPDLPSNETSSWQSAAQSAGFATPSAKNSQYRDPEVAEDEFEIPEKVFSPDGDGFNDVLLITYNLPEEGYTANILVFDSKGRRIKRLASNLTLGTSGTLKWDGVTDDNRKAPVGAYVVFIEAFTLKSGEKNNIKQYKKTCVVATRFSD